MQNYNKLATYLRQLLTTPTHIKTIIYSPNFPLNVASSYSLLSCSLANYDKHLQLKQLIEKKQKTSVSNPYLFSVLVSQLANTGKIKGGGCIKRLITSNMELVKGCVGNIKTITKKRVQIRARIKQVPEWLAGLTLDPHVPKLFDCSYQQYSELNKQHNLVKNKDYVIQSKSSCLPAVILFQGMIEKDLNQQYNNFDIIDCCAAPGNKTIQLAEYLGSKGTVFAFEKDPKRYQLLTQRISFYGVKNIVAIQGDFLTSNPKEKKFQKVRFVLADPSCSGSGMLTNIQKDFSLDDSNLDTTCNNLERSRALYNNLSEEQKQRVQNLKQFQINILKHAASFNPLRLSYSTCSIYQQEDEEVVEEFTKACPQYSVKNIRSMEGLEKSKCGGIRMWPFKKQTDGFFVCLFRRNS